MKKLKQALYTVIPVVLIFCLTIVFSGSATECPYSQGYIRQNVMVNPVCCNQGDSIPVTITSREASDFDLQYAALTGVSFGQGITVNSLKKNNNHMITVNISVSPLATVGPRDIRVTSSIYFGTFRDGFCVQEMIPMTQRQPSQAIYGLNNQPPVMLPSVIVQKASVSASRVTPGTPVTITANVENRGTVNGSTGIKVYINGQEEATLPVTVSSGGSTTVTCSVNRTEPGVYNVYVGGASAGSFTVDEMADPGSLILVVSSVLLLMAAITGAIYFARRKQHAN